MDLDGGARGTRTIARPPLVVLILGRPDESVDMKHIIKHDLSPEMAKKVADKAAERYTAKFAKYDAKMNWVNDSTASVSFRVKGIAAAATIELKPGQIEADMDVPLLLRPFKKLALSVVDETFQKWIDKAHNGELDD